MNTLLEVLMKVNPITKEMFTQLVFNQLPNSLRSTVGGTCCRQVRISTNHITSKVPYHHSSGRNENSSPPSNTERIRCTNTEMIGWISWIEKLRGEVSACS